MEHSTIRRVQRESAHELIEAARDAGHAYHERNPEALAVEAAREASACHTARDEIDAFLEGFKRARELRDEFLRDRKGD